MHKVEQRRFSVGASQTCTHSSQVRLGKNDDGSPIYSIFDASELFRIEHRNFKFGGQLTIHQGWICPGPCLIGLIYISCSGALNLKVGDVLVSSKSCLVELNLNIEGDLVLL